jgi:hypothetical protein
MQHVALTHEDYRKAVKDWVMKQPDDRRQVFSDWNSCIVGQFLHSNPAFRPETMNASYSFDGPANVWNSTHTDSYYDPDTQQVVNASLALSAGNSFATISSTFGAVKEAMRTHLLWSNL